jgi:hypothetical protein
MMVVSRIPFKMLVERGGILLTTIILSTGICHSEETESEERIQESSRD